MLQKMYSIIPVIQDQGKDACLYCFPRQISYSGGPFTYELISGPHSGR